MIRAAWPVLLSVLLAVGLSACAQESGEDPANQYHRYSNEELEAVCQAMVAQGQVLQAQLQQSAAAHAVAVQGAFVLGQPQVQPLPGGGWRISVDLQGTRPGRYRLELDRLNARKRLRTEALTLTQGQTLQTQQWDLSREEVVGATRLPAIFPLAISLFYLMPRAGSDPADAKPLEHLGSLQNLTLSAQ